MENTKTLLPETLQLSPDELKVIYNPSLEFESGLAEGTNVVYGRMLTGKAVNKAGLKNLFDSLWKNSLGVLMERF